MLVKDAGSPNAYLLIDKPRGRFRTSMAPTEDGSWHVPRAQRTAHLHLIAAIEAGVGNDQQEDVLLLNGDVVELKSFNGGRSSPFSPVREHASGEYAITIAMSALSIPW